VSGPSVMRDLHPHLDIGTRLVIVITFVLFVAALYIKGFGHGLLLEAGVFLVSVKLMLMAYKNSVVAKEVSERLDRMEAALVRMERTLESERPVPAAQRSDPASRDITEQSLAR